MIYILVLIATVSSPSPGEIILPMQMKFTTKALCLEQVELVRPHMDHIFSQLLPPNSYRNQRIECIEDKSGDPI